MNCETSASEAAISQQCDQPYLESNCGRSEDSGVTVVERSGKNASSTKCADVIRVPTTAGTAVDESVNTSIPGKCNNKKSEILG